MHLNINNQLCGQGYVNYKKAKPFYVEMHSAGNISKLQILLFPVFFLIKLALEEFVAFVNRFTV